MVKNRIIIGFILVIFVGCNKPNIDIKHKIVEKIDTVSVYNRTTHQNEYQYDVWYDGNKKIRLKSYKSGDSIEFRYIIKK